MNIISKIVVGFILVVAGGFYAVFFTSAPFGLIESAMTKTGVQVQGMSGSLNSGISVKSIKYKSPDVDFEMYDANYSYAGLKEVFVNKAWHINDLSVKKLVLNIKKLGGPSSKKSKASKKKSKAKKGGTEEGLIKELIVDRIKFENILVTSVKMPMPVKIDHILMTNLVFNKAFATYGLIQVKSNIFNLKAQPHPKLKKQISLDRHGSLISGMIDLTSFTEKLKAPMSFEADYLYSKGQFQGNFSFFDGALKVDVPHLEKVALKAINLSLQDYFKVDLPFNDLNLDLNMDHPRKMNWAKIKIEGGSYKLGKLTFQFEPGTLLKDGSDGLPPGMYLNSFVNVGAGNKFQLKVSPAMSKNARSPILLTLMKNVPLTRTQFLSLIYHGQIKESFDPNLQNEIMKKQGFFAHQNFIDSGKEAGRGRFPASLDH
ncbi:MAG: hypothetical protein HOE90_15270 [Bacteriovoracaceae bacterium]|nr:hypothetical protein [Bacteriovoracaceae bacterium]